jgi:tRNA pseudouridine38-40 synthase
MAATAQRCARAVIEYDGTAFAGSQRQPNVRTVQGVLEEVLNRLTGERVQVRLAGRTDAGVHATGQVVAFCLDARYEWSELRKRLNAVLPPDLAVRSLRAARATFDPRREARWRVYRYRIQDGGASRPLERHRTLEIDDRLDVAAMQAAAARMTGIRDFAALGSHPRSTVRHVAEVRVTRRGNLIEVAVTADAFLRGMVRSIVAVLLEAGRGRLSAPSVDKLLDGEGRALEGRAAPARGLTLERVVYGQLTNGQPTTEGGGRARKRSAARTEPSGEQAE